MKKRWFFRITRTRAIWIGFGYFNRVFPMIDIYLPFVCITIKKDFHK